MIGDWLKKVVGGWWVVVGGWWLVVIKKVTLTGLCQNVRERPLRVFGSAGENARASATFEGLVLM